MNKEEINEVELEVSLNNKNDDFEEIDLSDEEELETFKEKKKSSLKFRTTIIITIIAVFLTSGIIMYNQNKQDFPAKTLRALNEIYVGDNKVVKEFANDQFVQQGYKVSDYAKVFVGLNYFDIATGELIHKIENEEFKNIYMYGFMPVDFIVGKDYITSTEDFPLTLIFEIQNNSEREKAVNIIKESFTESTKLADVFIAEDFVIVTNFNTTIKYNEMSGKEYLKSYYESFLSNFYLK